MVDLAAAITTGMLRDGARPLPAEPNPLSRAVMTTNLVAAVPEAGSGRPCGRRSRATRRRGAGCTAARRRSMTCSPMSTRRAAALYARLPMSQRAALRAVSPASHVTGLRAPVSLMHDRDDALTPFTESRHFTAALTAAGRPPCYSEFGIFQPVDPTRGGTPLVVARDLVELFPHVRAVLARPE